MKHKGFTLAEVLITLAIIGVVAAIAVPSVISNSQQQEFKTGLRKAVSVLNSAISMNMALDGETPYDNANLYGFLQKHMGIIKSTTAVPWAYQLYRNGKLINDNSINMANAAFYTTDGIRFELVSYRANGNRNGAKLHESGIYACDASAFGYADTTSEGFGQNRPCGGCGSYGLKNNPNNTTKVPCAILIDVNGDKKPTPGNVNCYTSACTKSNLYKVPFPDSKSVRDTFLILITEDRAMPYGVTAQKAMYNSQK